MLIQRPTGFWCFPTNRDEQERYNQALDEYAKFGADSVTVTWSALCALKQIHGNCPDRFLGPVRRELDRHLASDGSYGEPQQEGLSAHRHIKLSPRHAAYSILIRLAFLRDNGNVGLTVRWILDCQSRTKGWRYVQEGFGEDEAISTAACIAALGFYYAEEGLNISAAESRRLQLALRQGWKRLVSLRNTNGLWPGHIIGRTDVADTACIIHLVSLRPVKIALSGLIEHFTVQLNDHVEQLFSLSLGCGWPDAKGGETDSLAATVYVLALVEQELRSSSARLIAAKAERFVLGEVTTKLSAGRLMGWDWVLLAALAAEKANLTSDASLVGLERDVVRVRQQMTHNTLTEVAIAAFPMIAREPMLFVVSRGNPNILGGDNEPEELQSAKNPASYTKSVASWAASLFLRGADTAFLGYFRDGLSSFVRFVVRHIVS